MAIFGVFKYFDAKFLAKKFFGHVDVKGNLAKIKPLLKQAIRDLADEYSASREKLKDIPGTNYNLGIHHMKQGNIEDAIMRFRMVCFLTPENIESHYNMGRCLLLAGNEKDAREKMQKILQMDSKHQGAKYQLNKIDKPNSIKSIPTAIIKELVELQTEEITDHEDYTGTAQLIDELLINTKDKNPNFDVLDLGCGKGICGKLLKQRGVAKTITGVELATDMVAKSSSLKVNKQNVYNKVQEAQIADYLKSCKQKFDLIISELSLTYIGDLSVITNQLKQITKSKALVAILVAKDDNVDKSYQYNSLDDSFSYSDQYLKDSFTKAGFKQLSAKEIELSDSNNGYIFIYQR